MILHLAILAAMTATPAAAGALWCEPAPDMIEKLDRDYGEGVLATGTAGLEQRIIITLNEATGLWTILVVRPDGVACAPAAGTDWRMMPQGDPA